MIYTQWMQQHRKSILFLLALLAIGGLISSVKLPVSLFPNVSFPRVLISLEAGDRPSERMAIEVTWPIEEAVRSIPNVLSVRSTTSRGSADISVNFTWGVNMVEAMLQVESAINQVLASLPKGTTFTVRRMDPTVFPVLAYSLTSDTHSLAELHDIAQYQLRPLLSSVQGVAKVGVLGGALEEYRVTINPARLASYGLSFADVAKALSAANIITVVGRLEDNYKLYLAVSDTRFPSVAQIRATVLHSGKNGVVMLGDVAVVSRDTAPQWTRVAADGHDAVIFQIYQQPGGNTVQIAKELKARLSGFSKQLPKSVTVSNWYDQSELILASAASVRDGILIGVALSALILLVFLRNLKITFILIILVPGVLAATLLLLNVLHMSFNIMTLGGMAAAIGLIIDDNIVMVEHIMRRLREGAGEYNQKILSAAYEFTRPLTGSSLSTIIIFAPLAFLSGVTGAFFKALSLTMASALIISYFVAWLAAPMMAVFLLREKDAVEKEKGVFAQKVQSVYESAMRRLFASPVLILVAVIPLVLAGWFSFKAVGSGFMPSMDEGGFIIDYKAPWGTSLTETDRLVRQVEAILRKTPDVQTYSRRTGLGLGGGINEANQGDFFVRLKPFPRRPITKVMDEVRLEIGRSIPGLNVELAQLMEDLIGDLTAVPQPIEIKVYSDDGKLLEQLGPKIANAIQKVPGVVYVKSGIVYAGDALDITINRVKASFEGVDPESVTQMLTEYLSGAVTTQVQQGPKMVDVRAWVPKEVRSTVNSVKNLLLRAPDGHLFPLKRIAAFQILTGQPQIMRDDLKTMIAVTGRISGRDMGSTIRDISAVLKQPGLLPNGINYNLGGLYRQQQIAFAGLSAVFAAAVMLVFLLLLVLYENFGAALSILVASLLAASAVFIGLWLTGTELNISSMMGMTMVIGIATEVAVFYTSEYYDLQGKVNGQESLVLAGTNRMRPIAMTTFAAILTLLPLAIGIGQGSAMQKPLAIAIISGLIAQLPLVLVVLPVFFKILGVSKK